MMPMLLRRKACRMEKVENLYRTATAENTFPTRPNNSDHACASLCATVEPARLDVVRRKMKT
jgi:hypothetical protein